MDRTDCPGCLDYHDIFFDFHACNPCWLDCAVLISTTISISSIFELAALLCLTIPSCWPGKHGMKPPPPTYSENLVYWVLVCAECQAVKGVSEALSFSLRSLISCAMPPKWAQDYNAFGYDPWGTVANAAGLLKKLSIVVLASTRDQKM